MSAIDKTNAAKPHHYIRTTLASVFGFLALTLIIVGILAIWLNNTVSNTSQYAKTVGPLTANPDVQAFVVSRATSALLDNKEAPVQDIAQQLLGGSKAANQATAQLRAAVAPIIKDSLQSVVASPTFADLWKTNNSLVHEQFIRQLKTNSPTIQLNFQPLITGTINELGNTKLGFVKDKLELKDTTGVVVIEGQQLETFRKVYNNFQKALLAIIGLAVAFTILCIVISVHHWKTVRRIALLTGIFAGVLAVALSASSLITVSGDPLQQKFVIAIINRITYDLKVALIAIAVLGIGGATASKVYDTIKAKKLITEK